MEIGGYMGLEPLPHHPYYPELYALNLGRTALIYLLKALKCKTLFVPYYLCDSVTGACEREGFSLSFYHVDEALTPLLPAPLPDSSYLYLVNHYGQLTDHKIRQYKELYGQVIVDHTHSFFQRPLAGIPTLYSCRKFFGVSDGAYLSTDLDMPPLKEQDISKDRMAHILGRFEESAAPYYHVLHQNADTFAREPIKRMSRLTQNLLGAIDYDFVRTQRNENYMVLHNRLASYNPLNFISPDGPLAYPFYHPNGILIRKELARQQIYVPTYWSNIIASMPADCIEYRYAANILALPCDQRYSAAQMVQIADALLTLLNEYGETNL